MNTDVMPSRVQVESILLKQLTNEVKETLATGIVMPTAAESHNIKAIDVWNIQRRSRYFNSGIQRKKNGFVSLSHVSF